MEKLETLENKIRQSIPELEEEFEAFKDGSIDLNMITPIMLNHVLEYMSISYKIAKLKVTIVLSLDGGFHIVHDFDGLEYIDNAEWDLKQSYLKDQSEKLINYLNDLK